MLQWLYTTATVIDCHGFFLFVFSNAAYLWVRFTYVLTFLTQRASSRFASVKEVQYFPCKTSILCVWRCNVRQSLLTHGSKKMKTCQKLHMHACSLHKMDVLSSCSILIWQHLLMRSCLTFKLHLIFFFNIPLAPSFWYICHVLKGFVDNLKTRRLK